MCGCGAQIVRSSVPSSVMDVTLLCDSGWPHILCLSPPPPKRRNDRCARLVWSPEGEHAHHQDPAFCFGSPLSLCFVIILLAWVLLSLDKESRILCLFIYFPSLSGFQFTQNALDSKKLTAQSLGRYNCTMSFELGNPETYNKTLDKLINLSEAVFLYTVMR